MNIPPTAKRAKWTKWHVPVPVRMAHPMVYKCRAFRSHLFSLNIVAANATDALSEFLEALAAFSEEVSRGEIAF